MAKHGLFFHICLINKRYHLCLEHTTNNHLQHFHRDGLSYQFTKYHTGELQNVNAFLFDLEKDFPLQEQIISTHRIDVKFVNANAQIEVIPESKSLIVENYFGEQYGNGITNIPTFEKITCKNIYPNIDWVLYSKNGKLKYDLILHPGAPLEHVVTRQPVQGIVGAVAQQNIICRVALSVPPRLIHRQVFDIYAQYVNPGAGDHFILTFPGAFLYQIIKAVHEIAVISSAPAQRVHTGSQFSYGSLVKLRCPLPSTSIIQSCRRPVSRLE